MRNQFHKFVGFVVALVVLSGTVSWAHPEPESTVDSLVRTSANDLLTVPERQYLRSAIQLTSAGLRSGEGYFSRNGQAMVYQAEVDASNPFYQIYRLDRVTGVTERVSPGLGKTTCAWIHPNDQEVLFSSTHLDPLALQKQQEELERRRVGAPRPYSWDFDENYDLFIKDLRTGGMTVVAPALGYDAEGSFSPDGEWIAFASNRAIFERELTPAEREQLARDPSYFLDLYVVRKNGTGLRRLTQSPGYDGGPFFSPDGTEVVYRHFSEDGRTAEIQTVNLSTGDIKQVTRLGVMSWAPFYHPSGDYFIFATSLHGHRNFELYVVDRDGTKDPIRITERDGFDGLPVFSPDGHHLSWTSARTPNGASHLFWADWNDQEIRQRLGLRPWIANHSIFSSKISMQDAKNHVEFLASEFREGRLTGTPGELKAARYLAKWFEKLGLKTQATLSTNDSFLHSFEYSAGVTLGAGNELAGLELNQSWRPLGFSKSGVVPAMNVVFAGYGIEAPAGEGFPAYDSYAGIDPLLIRGRWVVVLRFEPEEITPDHRAYLARFSGLRQKMMSAREKGAAGLIVVSGPRSKVKNQLIALGNDSNTGGATTLFAVSVADAPVDAWLRSAQMGTLEEIQSRLDRGESYPAQLLGGITVGGKINLQTERKTGHNVIGRLQWGPVPSDSTVWVGAHYDHLGDGRTTASRAREDEMGQFHVGADDNASGVAGVLEIAALLATDTNTLSSSGQQNRPDVVFAFWSGEELGTLGSIAALQEFEGTKKIRAYFNLDMVGRLRDALQIQGVGSAVELPGLIQSSLGTSGEGVGFPPYRVQEDPYLPTDSISFYLAGIPGLSFFTGNHDEYHSPRDLPWTLNWSGIESTARTVHALTVATLDRDAGLTYRSVPRKPNEGRKLRVFLGTIPDYTYEGDPKGVKLSGVRAESPAQKAGLQAGDVLVKLAGHTIENIYDYTYILSLIRPGENQEIQFYRAGEIKAVGIVPEAL